VANRPDAAPPFLALDGGTTNTRARLVVGDRVVRTSRRPLGVRDALEPTGRDALAAAVGDCLEEIRSAEGLTGSVRVVAAGMLGSEVGLCPVPHVEAPAGVGELARGAVAGLLPEVSAEPILFVPGVRTPAGPGPDGWAEADVMRGEECETIGAWHALGRPGEAAFLWPGSHTKLVAVDAAGRIVGSVTTLAGELMAAVGAHTLIAASLPGAWPDDLDPEAAAAGLRLAGASGIGRAAFLVRLAALGGRWDASQRAAFWFGAVVGDDLAHLARHPILSQGMPTWVGGRSPQRALYADALAARHVGPVEALDPELAEAASALGAVAVASARGWAGEG
jgi:2-dehydro-3-deoxygalactonokinase